MVQGGCIMLMCGAADLWLSEKKSHFWYPDFSLLVFRWAWLWLWDMLTRLDVIQMP